MRRDRFDRICRDLTASYSNDRTRLDGEPIFYQILAEETAKHRRFVFVETHPQFVNAWQVAAGAKLVELAAG